MVILAVAHPSASRNFLVCTMLCNVLTTLLGVRSLIDGLIFSTVIPNIIGHCNV